MIQNKIFTIRGIAIMLDSNLAKLYGVEAKHINQAVRNNPDKFPDDFLFELTKEEFDNLKSTFLTSSWGIPTQGIFYNGQIFDAYKFINDLLKTANKEVVLIDNYIDDTILTLFSKYKNLQFTIILQKISKQLKLDIEKYNSQFKNLNIK